MATLTDDSLRRRRFADEDDAQAAAPMTPASRAYAICSAPVAVVMQRSHFMAFMLSRFSTQPPNLSVEDDSTSGDDSCLNLKSLTPDDSNAGAASRSLAERL